MKTQIAGMMMEYRPTAAESVACNSNDNIQHFVQVSISSTTPKIVQNAGTLNECNLPPVIFNLSSMWIYNCSKHPYSWTCCLQMYVLCVCI